ncbi:hypothetical protein PM082_023193 [Marasmius tenuissimus]|nr:hypothetical protein PM082_023193 [Marasmius tenuissimus]
MTLQKVDDHDPQVHFTPRDAWFSGGLATEFKETTRGTTTAGALMTLNFTGTGVEVYGSAPLSSVSPAVLNLFTVDGGIPVRWSQDPRTWSGPPTNVKMFSALDLEDGTHTLVMQVTVEGSATWIDYLEVTSNESSLFTASSAELSSSTPPSDKPPSSTSEGLRILSSLTILAPTSFLKPTSSTQRNTASGSGSPTPARGSASDTDGVLPPGTVAGIAVGGTSGLFLMLLLIVWGLRRRWWRSKKRSGEAEEAQSRHKSDIGRRGTNTGSNAHVRPFPLFASTVETPRKQLLFSGGVSQPIRDSGSDDQPNVPRREDLPPSYGP